MTTSPSTVSTTVHPVHSVHRWTKWTEGVRPMPTIRADGVLFRRRCFARADKGSGTCPSGTARPPRKATFIATLRCKTVSGQASHRLADALRSTGPRAARLLPQTRTQRTYKGKRSRSAVSCSARSACSTTASSPCRSVPPGPPRGRQSPGRRGASATVSALNPQS